jgi:hypothetical protein
MEYDFDLIASDDNNHIDFDYIDVDYILKGRELLINQFKKLYTIMTDLEGDLSKINTDYSDNIDPNNQTNKPVGLLLAYYMLIQEGIMGIIQSTILFDSIKNYELIFGFILQYLSTIDRLYTKYVSRVIVVFENIEKVELEDEYIDTINQFANILMEYIGFITEIRNELIEYLNEKDVILSS